MRGALRLGAALATPRRMGEFARLGALPVRRFVEEEFAGEGPALLFAANALHADFAPESAGGASTGWCSWHGPAGGLPVAEGGSGALTAALVRRLEAAGGRVECGVPVERIVIRSGRAAGVRTADGREHRAPRAVLADVGAPQLYERLVGAEHLPCGCGRALRRFQYDHGTVKVDWALDGPVPWGAPGGGPARARSTWRSRRRAHATRGPDRLAQGARAAVPGRGPVRAHGPHAPARGRRDVLGLHPRPAARSAATRAATASPAAGTSASARRGRTAMEAELERFAPGFR